MATTYGVNVSGCVQPRSTTSMSAAASSHARRRQCQRLRPVTLVGVVDRHSLLGGHPPSLTARLTCSSHAAAAAVAAAAAAPLIAGDELVDGLRRGRVATWMMRRRRTSPVLDRLGTTSLLYIPVNTSTPRAPLDTLAYTYKQGRRHEFLSNGPKIQGVCLGGRGTPAPPP